MKNLTAMLALIVLASCSKEKTTRPIVPNNSPQQPALKDEEKFLVGTWVFDKAIDTLRPKNDYNNPKVTEGTIPCKMDDVYVLRADKKYTKDEGRDSCNVNAAYGEFEWGLTDNGGMTFNDGPNPGQFINRFKKIDDNHFSITWSSQLWEGHKTLVYFFKKKQ